MIKNPCVHYLVAEEHIFWQSSLRSDLKNSRVWEIVSFFVALQSQHSYEGGLVSDRFYILISSCSTTGKEVLMMLLGVGIKNTLFNLTQTMRYLNFTPFFRHSDNTNIIEDIDGAGPGNTF